MNDTADYKWCPMRVTYGRELKVKASLDSLGIDNYVPMTYHVVESQGERHKKLELANKRLCIFAPVKM